MPPRTQPPLHFRRDPPCQVGWRSGAFSCVEFHLRLVLNGPAVAAEDDVDLLPGFFLGFHTAAMKIDFSSPAKKCTVLLGRQNTSNANLTLRGGRYWHDVGGFGCGFAPTFFWKSYSDSGTVGRTALTARGYNGGRGGPRNMRFCETNPIAMLANSVVTFCKIVGCEYGHENLNPVRLAKRNRFWENRRGTDGVCDRITCAVGRPAHNEGRCLDGHCVSACGSS